MRSFWLVADTVRRHPYFSGLVGLVALVWLTWPPPFWPATPASCGYTGARPGLEKLIVHVRGRERMIVPDLTFPDPHEDLDNKNPSYLPLALPPGPPLDLVVSSDDFVLLALSGATDRLASVEVLRVSSYFDVAIQGVSASLVRFAVSPRCVRLVGDVVDSRPLPIPQGTAGPVTTVAYDWRRGPPAEGIAYAAVPQRWPRSLPLPTVVPVDPASLVATAPMVKPVILPGWGGFVQLLERGELRRPLPGEAEAALEQARSKYASRFTPGWRPGFNIDFVMVTATPLPRPVYDVDTATVLLPDDLQSERDGPHCILALGPNTAEPRFPSNAVRRPPPYVFPAHKTAKCLGLDETPFTSPFATLDEVSTQVLPGCGGVKPEADDVVVAIKDEQPETDGLAPEVDVALQGSRRAVLIGNANRPRRWRVHEAFPGQVRAFLLAEYDRVASRPDPKVEGLRPEQVVLDSPRLSDLRKRGPVPDYRSADLLTCEAARPNSWARGYPTTSVSERTFDDVVFAWTGRNMDVLRYSNGSGPIAVDVDDVHR